MEDRELLARIDRHMERGNQLMDELRAEVSLSRTSAAEALERYVEMQSDLRGFIQQMVAWMDRSLRDQRAEIRAELRDLREESRAQRSALLRLLDRLDGPGGSSAPA